MGLTQVRLETLQGLLDAVKNEEYDRAIEVLEWLLDVEHRRSINAALTELYRRKRSALDEGDLEKAKEFDTLYHDLKKSKLG